MNSVCIFCGSGSDGSFDQKAYDLGKELASRNIQLIYGGAKIGLMGKVADGAIDNDGSVIGIIPKFLKTKEVAHERLTKLIEVTTMHERKTKMNELCDGIITLPGGFGTMEEFFEVITWAQLGLHNKPIGILNLNNFYSPMMDQFAVMQNHGLIQQDHLNSLIVEDSISTLLDKMS